MKNAKVSLGVKAVLVFGLSIGAVGCGPYSVTDTSTGKIYYTKRVKDSGGGSVRFKDSRTDQEMTLQATGVKKVSKRVFLHGPDQTPGSGAAPAGGAPAAGPTISGPTINIVQ